MEGFSAKAFDNLKIDESFFPRTIFRNQSFLLMVWFNLIFSFMPRSLKFTHDTNLFLPFHHLFPTGIFLVILLCFIYLFTPQVFASYVAKIIGKIIKLIHFIHLEPWFEIYFIRFSNIIWVSNDCSLDSNSMENIKDTFHFFSIQWRHSIFCFR